MIAVVTSTIKPQTKNIKSFYNFNERLEQTKLTLKRLEECGFTSVFLIDNSPSLNQLDLKQLLVDFSKVQIHHIQQYQFKNKGITELMMMLYLIKLLPTGQNILKISGRYYPTTSFKKPEFFDFAVKGYQYKQRTGTVSTRAYWIKDTKILEAFLLSCLKEYFVYPERITGVRSFYQKLKRLFFSCNNVPLDISIEFAAANVLKNENHEVTLIDNIGVEGLIAGTNQKERIIE